MLNTKLEPCANLLYHWLLIHQNTQKNQPFNLSSFKTWSGEFLPTQAEENDILKAILVLKNLKLIIVENQFIYLNPQFKTQNNYIYPLPKYYLLRNKNNKNNVFLWGILMLVTFLGLWSGCLLLSMTLAKISTSEIVPLTPYSVLEKND